MTGQQAAKSPSMAVFFFVTGLRKVVNVEVVVLIRLNLRTMSWHSVWYGFKF